MRDRSDAAESKTACKMLRFKIETALGGRESRMCQTAVAGYGRAMFALWSRYGRTMFALGRLGRHNDGGFAVASSKFVSGLLLGEAIADC